MFNFFEPPADRQFIKGGTPSDIRYIEYEINSFRTSPKRRDMLLGERYYLGLHDILSRKRTAIGEGGKTVELDNLPNNRIVDNRYKMLVDQKTNYLLGQPITVRSDNRSFVSGLKEYFSKDFMRIMKGICEDSLNGGIAWLYIYYDGTGRLRFKSFKPYEIIPGWADSAHTRLDYAIRLYKIEWYHDNRLEEIEKVEVYEAKGISCFTLKSGHLHLDEFKPYYSIGGNGYGFDRIPLIAFKYNPKELPLIKNVKSLQDGLNVLLSNFQNSMEEDVRNTILVIKNYDGEDLGQFRRNLSAYGAVKVKTVDGSAGGVETLNIDVNAENYKAIIDIFKKAIVENGKGYDAKDERLSGSPNQMNIMSMYSDIDLDANGMETEYQAALEQVLYFVINDMRLHNTNAEDAVEFVFNRDILISESEAIDNCIKSASVLSEETIIAQHPWVDDVEAELKRKNKQDGYANHFDKAGDKNAE